MEFVGLLDKASYRLSELSGGLRQRAAIAQALVSDPQLLMLDEPLANLDLASQRATVHVLAKLNRELGMTIQVVAHDLNMLLPILTGAVYLLDGHPHYARMNEVLDSELLTHLYGTTVQVVTTPQGDMFVTPSDDEPRERNRRRTRSQRGRAIPPAHRKEATRMSHTAFAFDPDWMSTLTAPFMGQTHFSPDCASPWLRV